MSPGGRSWVARHEASEQTGIVRVRLERWCRLVVCRARELPPQLIPRIVQTRKAFGRLEEERGRANRRTGKNDSRE